MIAWKPDRLVRVSAGSIPALLGAVWLLGAAGCKIGAEGATATAPRPVDTVGSPNQPWPPDDAGVPSVSDAGLCTGSLCLGAASVCDGSTSVTIRAGSGTPAEASADTALQGLSDASVATDAGAQGSAAGDGGAALVANRADADLCAPQVVDWTAPPKAAAVEWTPSTAETYQCPTGNVRVHVRDVWSSEAPVSLRALSGTPVAISVVDVKGGYVEYWARRDNPGCTWYSACLPKGVSSLQFKAVGSADACTQTTPSGTFDLAAAVGTNTEIYVDYRGTAAALANDFAAATLGAQAFTVAVSPSSSAACPATPADAGAVTTGPSTSVVTVHFRWPWGDPTNTGFAGTSCELTKLGQSTPAYPTSLRVLGLGGCAIPQAMLEFQDGHCPWYTVQVPRSLWSGTKTPSLQFAMADWRVQLTSAAIDLPSQPPNELWMAYGGPPDDNPTSGTACQDYSGRTSSYHTYLINPGPGYPHCGSANTKATVTLDPCAPPAPDGYSTVHFRYLWAGPKTLTLFPKADAMPKWLLLQVNGTDVTCTREADRPWFNCAVPNSEFREGAMFRAVDRTREPEDWTTALQRPFATEPGEYWVKWESGRPESTTGEFGWYNYYPDATHGDWSATGTWRDQKCARKAAATSASVGFGAGTWFPYARTDYSYPFGASLARVYPNSSKVQEVLNSFVFQRYVHWKNKYVVSGDRACGPGTARVVAEMDSTFSEGQGYGLAMAAAIGDKDTFGQLWTFTRHYLSQSTKKYCGGLMGYKWERASDCRPLDQPCDPDIESCGSKQDSAFDADVDIAIGLIFAARQWPEYASAATAWLLKMECEVNTVYDGKRYFPAPGDTWDKYCSTPGTSCRYQPGYDGTVNLSYYPPGYFRAFGDYLAAHLPADSYTDEMREAHRALWNKTAQTVYDMHERCYDNKAVEPGLSTDWGTYTKPCDHNSDNYNWARALWRVSVDAAWFGNRLDLPENQPGSSTHYAGKTRIQAKVDNIQAYFNDFYKKNPPESNANRFSTICRLLAPDGTASGCDPSYDHNSYFVNTALTAYANVFDSGGRTTAEIRREAIEEAISTTISNDRYYQESIGVYTMLFLSGNFPNPMDVP